MLGRDITVERDAAKGHVGLVLQRPRFSGYATVRETVQLFASFRAAGENADRYVELLGLTPKLDVRIAKLSGGERQRLAVAIGLMGEHEILLLDEPTSELDPQARRVVWQLVSMVARQRNCAVLMTTHQMEEAEVLCDRVYVIDHGRIIASGNPAQVIVENCDSMAVCFMVRADAIGMLRARFPAVEPTCHGQYFKASKQVRTVQEGQQVMRELLEIFGDGMLEVGLQRPNLEDVFIRLTGADLRG
jgi:ABC-2 type transport system ATP-binding protein